MLDPGSFSGKDANSPNPHRGPEPSHLMSLAIFISDTAEHSLYLKQPLLHHEQLVGQFILSADEGYVGFFFILAATSSANSGWVLRPVPTAVPPRAKNKFTKSFFYSRISELIRDIA